MTRAAAASPAALVDRSREGDRGALARLLTVVETGGADARAALVALGARDDGPAVAVVGVTGAPGSGKSTLTDRLVAAFRAAGERVAVLAIDPSSPFTGGAILGDRVRMQQHDVDAGVFVRSMATRGHLGGLASATPRAVRVLDAAGFDRVVIETVGVGQVEVEVASAADTVLVVVNPGWGDAVQAGKAGLLEVGDVFVVNKADRDGVEATVRDLEGMLALGAHRDWVPPVLRTVATTGEGVDDLVGAIGAHRAHLDATGEAHERRELRVRNELRALVVEELAARADALCTGPAFDSVVARVVARDLDPYTAAGELLQTQADEIT